MTDIAADNIPRPFSEVRKDVNTFLAEYYNRQAARAANIDGSYGFLWDAARKQHDAGGKRVRPYLCLFAYEALGGTTYTDVLPIAAALEILHSAMLAHDDIIDRDYVRRGSPNIAGNYQKKYVTLGIDQSEINHFSHAGALLSGDLLLSDTYQLLAQSTIEQDKKTAVTNLFGDAVFTVVGGELLDYEAALYPAQQADSLKIAELKTAFYSFAAPLMAGGILADASSETLEQLQNIGTNLGIAFQLADDLLGVFGDASKTGKTTLGDIREGKRTYVLQQTLQLASPQQCVILNEAIGNAECTSTMAKNVADIMQKTGAKSNTEQRIIQYITDTNTIVNKLSINTAYKVQFQEFIEQLTGRQT